jgi:hypothetical protein
MEPLLLAQHQRDPVRTDVASAATHRPGPAVPDSSCDVVLRARLPSRDLIHVNAKDDRAEANGVALAHGARNESG